MKQSALRTLLSDIIAGHRLSCDEALFLFKIHDRRVWEIASAADEMREKKAGDVITWVKNQNINVTNLCVNACGFCGFSKKPGDAGIYHHSKKEVQEKTALAEERGVTEICTVSGLHPNFQAQSYIDIISWIREKAPHVHIHASNPMEVAYGAEKSGWNTREVLQQMKQAGLNSLCGTAAEILDDRVRDVICPQKIDTATWMKIIREAHGLGIPTTATIMYGAYEDDEARVRHLNIIRDIQDETNGFTEFVPLSFIHLNTPLFRKGIARSGATGREDILMYSVSRLFLDNLKNLQVSWVKLGTKLAQLGLLAGANDLGGTLYEESISKGAGARNTDYMDPEEMKRLAEDLNRPFRQRTTLYRLI
ncbi:MAG: 5-amino-6-(D-ribitylamino)uracil--L-tyrosine 4-hydroxyphenyl transferase CofH [Methanomicrobiales archaeon]|nr:5-amino-6-(D-ribitylamino)uracil--L-tyrosine 4-hydroxyphenyl transferase CofH [Methanomicrobiales archaeon]